MKKRWLDKKMTNFVPTSHFPLTIEKIIPGGLGLGRRDDGLVVMARNTLPGERVMVRPVHQKKTYIEAELIEILTPSPDRVEPFCSHYGRCGSCDFQHISMDAQLRIKKEMLLENLLKDTILAETDAVHIITEPIPAPQAKGYRQRIRLQAVDGRTGFFQTGSHTIEPLTNCPLAIETVNRVAAEFCSSAATERLLANTENMEFILNPDTGMVGCLLHMSSKIRPAQLKKFQQIYAGLERAEFILFMIKKYGPVDISGKRTDTLPRLSFTLAADMVGTALQLGWEAGGFCQVNPGQNRNLIKKVVEFADPGPTDRLLDLYCGMGNLTLPLATYCGSIVGVEGQGSAIRSGRKNRSANGIDNCTFLQAPVPDGVRKLAADREQFDIIVLDPPRQGAAGIIPLLAAFNATKIVYVSCAPATLSRDLTGLQHNGYILKSITPIDMFPHTHHLESIALLEKAAT